jgi:hypothetical protein
MILNDQSQEAHDFLDKHIHARANILITELLDKFSLNWDIDEASWYQDLFMQTQQIEDQDPSDSSDYCPEPELCNREPYEFWIVSDYFAHKLKENNELLTNHWGFWIWGRETTGQSILLDYVFQKIYNDFKNS